MTDLLLSLGIVAFNIGLGLIAERECLRCIDLGRRKGFAIHQAMKKIQDMVFVGTPDFSAISTATSIACSWR